MTGKTKAPAKKKATPKKAEPFPPNPTRPYGATVRKMVVDEKTASRLVSECEFRVMSKEGDRFVLAADSAANKIYEGQK